MTFRYSRQPRMATPLALFFGSGALESNARSEKMMLRGLVLLAVMSFRVRELTSDLSRSNTRSPRLGETRRSRTYGFMIFVIPQQLGWAMPARMRSRWLPAWFTSAPFSIRNWQSFQKAMLESLIATLPESRRLPLVLELDLLQRMVERNFIDPGDRVRASVRICRE